MIDLIDTANGAIDCLASVHFGETKSQPAFMLKVVANSTPSILGRVALARTKRDVFPDLMDILGSTFALSIDSDGAVDAGAAGYVTSAAVGPHLRRGARGVLETCSRSMRLALASRTFPAHEGIVTRRRRLKKPQKELSDSRAGGFAALGSGLASGSPMKRRALSPMKS